MARKKEKMLAQFLFDMATVLKFKIPVMEIFKGGYAPQGWAHRDEQQTGAYQFANDLAKGQKSFPIYVTNLNQPTTSAETSNTNFK